MCVRGDITGCTIQRDGGGDNTLIDTQGCGGELIFKRTSFVYFIPGHTTDS